MEFLHPPHVSKHFWLRDFDIDYLGAETTLLI